MMRISEEVRIAGGAQGDPRFHPLPLDVILSKEYAAMRLELLRMSDPSPMPAAPPGTNHINVVDGEGNVASLIHSCVCQPWSNGLFCDGFMVTAGGIHYLRRLPDPGGRVNLFLAPGLFLENGRPLLAVGSPSVAMLTAIVQNAVNVLDFGMDLEASVHLPRFGTAWGASAQAIEVDVPESLRRAVVGRGMKVEVTSPWHFTLGSFEGIHVDPGTAARSACGDPRRNSHAMTA
jgi:gamma-glutamyltranspeptidase/glutathione hydrolase